MATLKITQMPQKQFRCVECPKCRTRYIIGANPYRNGAFIDSVPAGDPDLRRLFCPCSDLASRQSFRLSELKGYTVSAWACERGYGSRDEVLLTAPVTK